MHGAVLAVVSRILIFLKRSYSPMGWNFTLRVVLRHHGAIMKVRENTRKQFWRKSQGFPHLIQKGRGNNGGRNNIVVGSNQVSPKPKVVGSLLFWLCLHNLMKSSTSTSARVTMKDDAIFSRPNTQGICTPILQPSTIQEQYLLRVYRALCHACHLHESMPSALFLTHKALGHARKNLKRNVPSGTCACASALPLKVAWNACLKISNHVTCGLKNAPLTGPFHLHESFNKQAFKLMACSALNA